MKKIPTLTVLEEALQQDLGWRRKELSSLYLSVISSKNGSDSQGLAIRSAILLSYAHLEGFVVHAARIYFEYVRGRALRYGELAPSFLAIKVSRLCSQGTTKASYYGDAVAMLLTCADDLAVLPSPEVISAASNLNYEQLREILYCLNIDSRPLELKANFLDEVLLKRRNAIAHGEFRGADLSDYLEIHTGVLDILDSIDNLVVTGASLQSFRR